MEPKIVDLDEENLIEAPEWGSHPYSCKYCLYWEHPEPGPEPDLSREEGRREAFRRKIAWLRRVRTEWGNCGRILFVGNKAVSYAQYAPARFLPGAAEYPAGPASEDAVLISCLFIPSGEHRRRGLGSALLSAILEELRGRGIAAVETFARRGSPENPSGPVEFYLAHGFRVLRDGPGFPLLRRELT